jgi:hypothetical protein
VLLEAREGGDQGQVLILHGLDAAQLRFKILPAYLWKAQRDLRNWCIFEGF